jgi:hypothetical protein
MRVSFNRTQIIDRHNLKISAARLNDKAQDVAADASEAVDRHSHGHLKTPCNR